MTVYSRSFFVDDDRNHMFPCLNILAPNAVLMMTNYHKNNTLHYALQKCSKLNRYNKSVQQDWNLCCRMSRWIKWSCNIIQDVSERARGGGDVFFKAESTRLSARAGRGCQKGNCPSPCTMYIAYTLYVHSTLYRATHYACRMYIKHAAWLPPLSHHRQWIWLTNWLT